MTGMLPRAIATWTLLIYSATVILQAMKADPPLDSRCRDKFLVQSAAISADKDFSNIATIVRSSHTQKFNCLILTSC